MLLTSLISIGVYNELLNSDDQFKIYRRSKNAVPVPAHFTIFDRNFGQKAGLAARVPVPKRVTVYHLELRDFSKIPLPR